MVRATTDATELVGPKRKKVRKDFAEAERKTAGVMRYPVIGYSRAKDSKNCCFLEFRAHRRQSVDKSTHR